MKGTPLHDFNGNKNDAPCVPRYIPMMLRVLLLFLFAAGLAARASDPITATAGGASDTVTAIHVTAELIPEKTTISPGEPFDVALHLHMDKGWHTYWINPGDAGLATTLRWTLPPGFTASPIQWPTPEIHKMGPEVTYGYDGDVYLLTTITPPKGDLPQHFDIKARADWLVCQEECIPGKAELTLPLDTGLLNLRLPIDNKDFFDEARERLPVPNTRWEVKGAYGTPPDLGGMAPEALEIMFKNKLGTAEPVSGTAHFFPEQPNVLDTQAVTTFTPEWPAPPEFNVWIKLQQNGEKPDRISGVLVSDQPLIGNSRAVYISDFSTRNSPDESPTLSPAPSQGAATATMAATNQQGEAQLPGQVRSQAPAGGSKLGNEGNAAPPMGTSAATTETASPSGGPGYLLPGSPQATGGYPSSNDTESKGSGAASVGGVQPPVASQSDATRTSELSGPTEETTAPSQGPATATEGTEPTAAQRAAATTEADDGHRPPLQLIVALGFAFVGGLILNLMPCVLPVLSLKVFSLMKHAGDDPRGAWKQGAAFTAGVVISFWILAGLLLILKAFGNHLGWGFQMQSPGFVLALIFLFFLLALNLFGVFELGTSLVGLDAKATGKFHGLTSSFLNGALATVAATPCTAPFMGSALGFAAQQPPAIALIIFTFLALGMATPYLLLTIFPGALRFVPKPGAWMEAFRQLMGFLLMASVIWLVYVLGALVGEDKIALLLFLLLLVGMAAWIYGRWGWFRTLLFGLAVVFLPMAFGLIFSEFGSASSVVGIFSSLLSQEGAADGDIGGYHGGSADTMGTGRDGVRPSRGAATTDGYQPWSQSAVDDALAQGRPVFVDFTAAWCLSCKVNEKVALETDAVKQAFAQKNVTLFQADWTHADPAISDVLQKYNRDGVPLYLLYSPKAKDAPQILPAVLTPGIVLEAVGKL